MGIDRGCRNNIVVYPSIFQENTRLLSLKNLYAILQKKGGGGKDIGTIDCNPDHVTKWLRNIGMAVISISGISWLFSSLASSANKGFGPGGVLFHVITPGLIFLAGAAVAWQWGVIGGIILIILGLFGFFLYLASLGLGLWAFIYALPTGLPPLVTGCLFIMSWWRAKRTKLRQMANNKRVRN